MTDLVVTVPRNLWADWIEEGDAVGEPETGEEWGFFLGHHRPPIGPGERLYIVAHDRLPGPSCTGLHGPPEQQMDDDTRADDRATPAPDRTDYTLTIEGRVLGSVVVGSTSAIKAGKWLRDVAMPNDLVFISPVKWDWTTAKATWDGDEPEPAKPPPAGLGIAATLDAVAAALADILPRRTSIFDVELVQATRGCTARARIGSCPHAQHEIAGLGVHLAEAIANLHNEARSWARARS